MHVFPHVPRTDFDPMVRQHLHAFHGLGGAAQVREALQEAIAGAWNYFF